MSEQKEVLTARALLSANVVALRAKLRISQEKLAELAGFHRTYVSQVERGATNVTLDNVERLAAVLEVPVAALLEAPPVHVEASQDEGADDGVKQPPGKVSTRRKR